MSEYSSTDARIDWFAGQDGTRLCLHIIGEGRPLVLLHGLFSSAFVNWIKFGTAAHLAKAGFQVFMLDLRAHGESAAPHDPAAYPSDILVQDARALMARSEEHTSELQSLMRISYAVFCLKKKKINT